MSKVRNGSEADIRDNASYVALLNAGFPLPVNT